MPEPAQQIADINGLRYSPDDPHYSLGPVHTSLYVRVTWDWWLGHLPRSPGTSEGGDWWSWPMGVKAEGTPRICHREWTKRPHPWDTHCQFSIKTLFSNKFSIKTLFSNKLSVLKGNKSEIRKTSLGPGPGGALPLSCLFWFFPGFPFLCCCCLDCPLARSWGNPGSPTLMISVW